MRHTLLTTISIISSAVLIGCQTTGFSPTASELVDQSLPTVVNEWQSIDERIQGEPRQWIDRLDDVYLRALVDEAQSNAPSLKEAKASLDRAKALTKQARAALAPQVSGRLGADEQGILEGGSRSDIGIGVDVAWEADLWGRLGSNRDAALQSFAAVEADYRSARNFIAGSVAQIYFLKIEAGLQKQIATDVVDAVSKIEQIVEIRLDSGLGSSQDLSLARADLARARDQLVQAEAAERASIRALEVLIGQYPAASLKVPERLPKLPSLPPTGIPSGLLERRPDLVAAERRIAAALSAVDVAKAAKLPSLTLTGSLGGSSNELSNLLDPSNVAWQAASSLLAPIFNGGALEAQVDLAKADTEALVASYVGAALNAFSEVETALDQHQTLKARKHQLNQATVEGANAYRIARVLYQEGESDLLDVLTIQQQLFESRSEQLSVDRLQLDQYIALNLALGGDWE